MDMLLFTRYRRWLADALMANGNHVADRLVMGYLLDRVDDLGKVGVGSAVSLARMASDLSEKPTKGRKPLVFDRHDVRNAVDRLCSGGFLLRLSEQGKGNDFVVQVVFSACPDVLHYSAQNKLTHSLRTTYAQKSDEKQGGYATSDGVTYAQLSINPIPSFQPPVRSEPLPTERFAMHSDWKPSEVFKIKINETWKPNEQQLLALKAKLFGFVAYWSTQPAQNTQAEWELKLWRNELEKLFTAPASALAAFKGNVTPIDKARASKPLPRALSVPDKLFGKVLQDWGVRNGFRAFVPGEEDAQYRSFLRNECERRNLKQEREAMGVKREC